MVKRRRENSLDSLEDIKRLEEEEREHVTGGKESC